MHEILNSMDIIEENGISELVESMEPLQYVMDKVSIFSLNHGRLMSSRKSKTTSELH